MSTTTTALVTIEFDSAIVTGKGYGMGHLAILGNATKIEGLAPYQVSTIAADAVEGVFTVANFPTSLLGTLVAENGAVVTATAA
jgi:hypothetical protein